VKPIWCVALVVGCLLLLVIDRTRTKTELASRESLPAEAQLHITGQFRGWTDDNVRHLLLSGRGFTAMCLVCSVRHSDAASGVSVATVRITESCDGNGLPVGSWVVVRHKSTEVVGSWFREVRAGDLRRMAIERKWHLLYVKAIADPVATMDVVARRRECHDMDAKKYIGDSCYSVAEVVVTGCRDVEVWTNTKAVLDVRVTRVFWSPDGWKEGGVYMVEPRRAARDEGALRDPDELPIVGRRLLVVADPQRQNLLVLERKLP
jgi:hypothetical protein